MANYIEARLAQFRADAEKQIQFHANRRLSMTDQQRPITPPQWRVQEWWEQADQYQDDPKTYFDYVATEAARWGADQELEACCALLELSDDNARDFLYSARRPKPLSLKEQALARTAAILNDSNRALLVEVRKTLELALRALEQLPK